MQVGRSHLEGANAKQLRSILNALQIALIPSSKTLSIVRNIVVPTVRPEEVDLQLEMLSSLPPLWPRDVRNIEWPFCVVDFLTSSVGALALLPFLKHPPAYYLTQFATSPWTPRARSSPPLRPAVSDTYPTFRAPRG